METVGDDRDGTELFRELRRFLPDAAVEEYYNYETGIWDKECLLIDIELIERHRQVAGAPEAPPLEEIPEVDLSQAARKTPNYTKRKKDKLKPAPPSEPPSAAARASQGQTDEEKELSNFTQRWRLDPTRTRHLISLVRPSRRRWIMQSFVHDGLGDAMQQLEALIEVSEGKVPQPASSVAPWQKASPRPSSVSNPRFPTAGHTMRTSVKRKLSDLSGHSDASVKRAPPMVGSVAKLPRPTTMRPRTAGIYSTKSQATRPAPRVNGSVGITSNAPKPAPRPSGSVGLATQRSPLSAGSVGRPSGSVGLATKRSPLPAGSVGRPNPQASSAPAGPVHRPKPQGQPSRPQSSREPLPNSVSKYPKAPSHPPKAAMRAPGPNLSRTSAPSSTQGKPRGSIGKSPGPGPGDSKAGGLIASLLSL